MFRTTPTAAPELSRKNDDATHVGLSFIAGSLLFCLICAWLIGLCTRYVNEDLFLSIFSGREIFSGIIAQPDRHTFTAPDRTWINQAWLSHALLYCSYRWFGPLGPVLWKAALWASCLAILWVRCRRWGVSREAALSWTVAGALAAAPFLSIRPEIFGVFCFVVFGLLVTERLAPSPARFTGIAVLIVLWSNLHGSFMLGLALLGFRAALETGRFLLSRFAQTWAGGGLKEPLLWWLLLAAALTGCAVANPFGLNNLRMPFTQLGTVGVTAFSADWLPLFSSLHVPQGLFGAGSVWPYLVLLGIATVGIAFFAVRVLFRQTTLPGGHERDIVSVWLMECAAAAVTVILAWKFRRMVLFSAMALVPFAALTWSLVSRSDSRNGSAESLRSERLGALVGVLLLLVAAYGTFRIAMVPYIPPNPLRPERPVVRELMSFDSFSPRLIEFLRRTDVGEHLFSGWTLSGYLLAELPDVKLFMDCRDQSLYPDRVILDYFTILGVVGPLSDRSLELLDRYRVSAVVLTTHPQDFSLGAFLMTSKRWVCLYADPDALLLVRADAPAYRRLVQSGDFSGITYPDSETEVFARSFFFKFFRDALPDDLNTAIRDAVRTRPWPNLYSILAAGMKGDRTCLSPEGLQYFRNEAGRLSRTNPLYPDGARQVIQSLDRICEILEADAGACGRPGEAAEFAHAGDLVRERFEQDSDYYLGRFLRF